MENKCIATTSAMEYAVPNGLNPIDKGKPLYIY